MTEQEQFLDAVAARLVAPDEVRSEILEELAAHLGDSVRELIEQGRTREAAEAEAIARLGPPEALARALAVAHRRPVQLLAAAGAGTWAAVRTGAFGTLVVWLVVGLLSIFASLLARTVAGWLGQPYLASGGWSSGWNTILTAAGLSIGGFFAAAASVRAVARRGWWTPGQVRAAVGIGGALILGVAVLGVLEQPLNWASVLAMLLVPPAFALGARLAAVPLPPRPAAVALLLALIVPVGVVSIAVSAGRAAPSFQWDERTHGYEMIGPWWQDPAAGAATDFPSDESWSTMTGVEQVTVYAANSAVVDRFQDFRLEAWRVEPPGDGWRLIPGQTRPFAVAPATVDGTAISGTLHFNRTPGVDWAQVVLTATGQDGRRYLLTASGPRSTVFYGSVVDWFTTLGE
jgi:hypothetical protein